MPLISIIIATLNVESTLKECLESIIQQTIFREIEILVKDGESKDSTVSILNNYNKNINYWESSPDNGIYDAWNSLIPKANGRWVLFLGADDTLYDNSVIARTLSTLDKLESPVDIAYGRIRLVTRNNEAIIDVGQGALRTRRCIKEKMCMPHQGIFHKRTLFEEYGNFSTEYSISSDYEFIRRVISEKNFIYLDLIVSNMRVGGVSSNPKYTFLRLREIRLINRKYGSIIPGPLWLITYTNACFRHSLFLLIGEKKAKFLLDRLRSILGLPPFWSRF